MGNILEEQKEEQKPTQSLLSKKSPKKSITKKIVQAQANLYTNHMEAISDPNIIDNDYELYRKLTTNAEEPSPNPLSRSKYNPKNSPRYKRPEPGEKPSIPKNENDSPFATKKQKGPRRLNIKLQDLIDASVEVIRKSRKFDKPIRKNNAPMVLQSTEFDMLRSAKLGLNANRKNNKIFETVVDANPNVRDSVALRIPEFKKKPACFDKISLLPPEIFGTIMLFLMDQFRELICVNPAWYTGMVNAFDFAFNRIENSFIKLYLPYLLFKDSYTSSSYIKCADSYGLRVDRVIKCENLPTTVNKTFIISYTYSYYGDEEKYKATYKFDSVPYKKKIMWVYKNECFFHGNQEDQRASTQGIVPIAINDNLEITLNFFSLKGQVNLDTIEWEKPILEDLPSENLMKYNAREKREIEKDKARKVFADLSRICELEDSEMEWRDFRCEYQDEKMFPFELLNKCFKIEQLEFSNVDNYVIKMTLRAACKGYNDLNVFGIGVKIVGDKEECTNEVKKSGLIIERYADIELRIGELLIFYYSKSMEEEDYKDSQVI